MERFSKFHPVVSFTFFIFAIFATVFLNNPVYAIISFSAAFVYRLKAHPKETLGSLRYLISLVALVAVFNMIFCHYGVVVLFTAFGYDFTLECLLYGASNGVMLSAVILWFLSYSEIITGEKFMALFGRVAPNLTLLFSMVLRFIPLMIKLSGEIKDTAVGMGKETRGVKNTINRFSALVSISLEKSIETADSMRARGFGKKKRRAYVRYSMNLQDVITLIVTLILSVSVIVAYVLNVNTVSFYYGIEFSNTNLFVYLIFTVFSFLPFIIDTVEGLKWHYLRLKI